MAQVIQKYKSTGILTDCKGVQFLLSIHSPSRKNTQFNLRYKLFLRRTFHLYNSKILMKYYIQNDRIQPFLLALCLRICPLSPPSPARR